MGGILGIGIWLLFVGLYFWSINALSVLRNQMDDVIARLDRIERSQNAASADRAP